ncbi:efflux RND transporter periplasmic adaptor subunit [Gracilimonas sp.]|uniref:efflux RND transporter periplasmic adaptor subunit n=1 Tax=Gracilimonas sp. TaxID=1974203 RepID=UPI003BAB2887
MNFIKMKNYNLLLVTLVAVFFAACSGGETGEADESEELVKTVNVVSKNITPSVFTSFVRVIGTVETSNDIMISAEVSGRVVSYSVEEGDVVREGQTIIKINDAKLKSEKARLEAMTEQARENYERLKRIYEEDGIGSEIDYLNAKYNYEQTKSALESIKVDLENTSIKAPFSGTVESKMIEVGEMVSPGTPVVRLIGTTDYIVSAGVPARYSDAVRTGDNVEVWFDTQDQAGDTLLGTVSFAGKSISSQNRTFRIEIQLPKANEYKVDMIANVRLKTYEQENAIVMSEEFIYSKEDGYVVYLVGENEDGQPVAKERKVTLGNSYKTKVIIEDGLEEGEELITIGSAFLEEGMRITLKEGSGSEIASN